MAAFKPYDERSAPPEPGAFEFDTLDFKGQLGVVKGTDKTDYTELAKDIAAFANAQGGVILVGAQEDNKRGYLGTIKGVGDDEAVKKVRDAYSKAATDHCRPSPVINSVVIEDDGKKLVAINVWPFTAGQAVGVRVDKDTWRFPMRVSIETIFLTPEQLPMLMIPELRRRVALLHSIGPDEPVEIYQPGFTGFALGTMQISKLNEIQNFIEFTAMNEDRRMRVSLDQIERVWLADGGWEILVSARIPKE